MDWIETRGKRPDLPAGTMLFGKERVGGKESLEPHPVEWFNWPWWSHYRLAEPVWRPCTTAPERVGVYSLRATAFPNNLIAQSIFHNGKWSYSDDHSDFSGSKYIAANCQWLDAPPAQAGMITDQRESKAVNSTQSMRGNPQRLQDVGPADSPPSPGDIALQRKEWREWFGAYQPVPKFGSRK